MESQKINYEEKELKAMNGVIGILLEVILLVSSIGSFIAGGLISDSSTASAVLLISLGVVLITVFCFCLAGFKIINPREALVLVLFGKYHGTLKEEGFYWVNPFCSGVNPAAQTNYSVTANAAGGNQIRTNTSGKKVSLKTMTLNNEKQKVNDVLGNPIIIGAVVIWRVSNPTKAVFNVNNYKSFLSIQCDSTIRNIARLYPYDSADAGGDEKTLRGSSQEIADKMKEELQVRAQEAGLMITEVRITHLSYAPEIAAAMLQRQQAVAIIDARQKIVEGAVGMVEMALTKLNENDVVKLDEERKAAMVSNLLVVLCGNKDAQPIVNSGSIY